MFKHILMQKLKQKRRNQRRQFFLFTFFAALVSGALAIFANTKQGKKTLKKAGEVISEKVEEGKEIAEKAVNKAKTEIKLAKSKAVASKKVVEVKAKPVVKAVKSAKK